MGRYFVRPQYDPAIFCEEVEVEAADEGERQLQASGHLWCRCYSTKCVAGEFGHLQPGTAIELTPAEFQLARRTAWKAGVVSRHTFDTEPDRAYWQVGWDQPMMTYFAQFYRVGEEDQASIWLGDDYRQFLSLEALEQAMATPLPDEVRAHLTLDKKVGSFDQVTGTLLE